jgi:hypothetical protein
MLRAESVSLIGLRQSRKLVFQTLCQPTDLCRFRPQHGGIPSGNMFATSLLQPGERFEHQWKLCQSVQPAREGNANLIRSILLEKVESSHRDLALRGKASAERAFARRHPTRLALNE